MTDAEKVKARLETLSAAELREVQRSLAGLIDRVESWQQPEVEGPHKTYRQEYARCSRANCTTCREGKGHGPYWYAYWREGGKLRKQYIGKNLDSKKGAE